MVANGAVYVGWGNLYAFKATTGALLPGWPTAYPKGPSSSIYSDPAVANGVVYGGARNDHGFYAFNATTGALLWSTPTGVPIGWADLVANGLGARLDRFLPFLRGSPCPNPFDQRPAIPLAGAKWTLPRLPTEEHPRDRLAQPSPRVAGRWRQ